LGKVANREQKDGGSPAICYLQQLCRGHLRERHKTPLTHHDTCSNNQTEIIPTDRSFYTHCEAFFNTFYKENG